MNKTLNLQYHGIFCIIWRHIKVFARCLHGKSMCPVIWWATGRESLPDSWKQWFCVKRFVESFRGNLALVSAYLFLCLHLFNISVRLFSILLSLCNAIFSFSFKHSEHLLLLVLYAWCLPKISHVMFALCLLSFTLQNLLDSSVSDLRFLWLNDFLWFAYLSLNVVFQIP